MANVLVIDDTEDIRSLVITTLNTFGFATCEANCGKAGILMALKHRPDVIVCDLNMPGMDGFGTLGAVREHKAISSIPFIFLTGSQCSSDFRRGMVDGADDFLTKPFRAEDLVEAVHSRLARHQELKQAMHREAEKLNSRVVHMISDQMRVPLEGIIGAASQLIEECPDLAPDAIINTARRINESAGRLNDFARSLAAA